MITFLQIYSIYHLGYKRVFSAYLMKESKELTLLSPLSDGTDRVVDVDKIFEAIYYKRKLLQKLKNPN